MHQKSWNQPESRIWYREQYDCNVQQSWKLII
jgi:hypothetical protein